MEDIEHIVRTPADRRHATPILLMHGAWHGAWCWACWTEYFESLGYEVHAINLPGRGKSSLNRGHINLYTFGDYVRLFTREVQKISPAPVVVGHSMGGAIVQKYLERHRLPGAVMMAPTPASGAARMMLRFMRRHPVKACKSLLTLNTYCFVETPELARELLLEADGKMDIDGFQRQLVPEAAAVGLRLLFPFAKARGRKTPILVFSGGKDNVFRLKEEKTTAHKFGGRLIVFEGQAHDMMLGCDWRKAAGIVHRWITAELGLP